SMIDWPVTSDGIRSGVNCTREKSASSAAASVFTSNVLATPGTPSSSTWPRTSSAATRPDSVPSWPTTTFPTSSRRARIALRAVGSIGGGTSAMEDLLSDGFDLGGHGEQLLVARHRAGGQDGEHGVGIAPGAPGD